MRHSTYLKKLLAWLSSRTAAQYSLFPKYSLSLLPRLFLFPYYSHAIYPFSPCALSQVGLVDLTPVVPSWKQPLGRSRGKRGNVVGAGGKGGGSGVVGLKPIQVELLPNTR